MTDTSPEAASPGGPEDGHEGRIRAVVSMLVVEAAARRVLSHLHAAGVDTVVLKGPALNDWLGDPARPTSDLDILVARAQVGAAEKVLADLSYRSLLLNFEDGDRPHHARTWVSSAGGADVDLHWTFVGVAAADPWITLRRRTVVFELAGVPTRVLDDTGQALQVALHAAQHGADGLRELRDLRRALQIKPQNVWASAAELAAELEAIPAFVAGLRLVPEGRRIWEALGVEATPTVETELRAASSLPHTALGWAWLASGQSRGRRTRFLLRKLFPPRAVVRSWASLRTRRQLTGPFLVLAYVWRIGWLVAKAPSGVLAWTRARRRAGG